MWFCQDFASAAGAPSSNDLGVAKLWATPEATWDSLVHGADVPISLRSSVNLPLNDTGALSFVAASSTSSELPPPMLPL